MSYGSSAGTLTIPLPGWSTVEAFLIIAGIVVGIGLLDKYRTHKNTPSSHREIGDGESVTSSKEHRTHPSDEEHRSAEQAHWKWQRKTEEQRDRVTVVTIALAVIASIAALLSLDEGQRQSSIFQRQLDEMRSDDVGWLDVQSFRMDGYGLEDFLGYPAYQVSFLYKNIGKSPSNRDSVIWNTFVQKINGRANAEDAITSTVPLAGRGACFASDEAVTINRSEKTIFPEPTGNIYSIHKRTVADVIQAFNNRSAIIWVQGCITYHSIGSIHHTWFCNYTVPDPTIPMEKWNFSICRGNMNGAD